MSSGGKREGAGRPSKGDRVTLSVRIDREVAERLKELATEREMTQGEVIEVAILKLKRDRSEMLDKACEWLKMNGCDFATEDGLVEHFREAMEE